MPSYEIFLQIQFEVSSRAKTGRKEGRSLQVISQSTLPETLENLFSVSRNLRKRFRESMSFVRRTLCKSWTMERVPSAPRILIPQTTCWQAGYVAAGTRCASGAIGVSQRTLQRMDGPLFAQIAGTRTTQNASLVKAGNSTLSSKLELPTNEMHLISMS